MMKYLSLIILCVLPLCSTFKVQPVDENEDPKEKSDMELEGVDEFKDCDKLQKTKDPEDENLNHEVAGAFDGDEILTKEQKEFLEILATNDTDAFNDTNDSTGLVERKLTLFSYKRWPLGVIPYVFSSGKRRFKMPRSKRNVYKAIKHWSANTCLTFVDVRSQRLKYKELKRQIRHGHYLSFGTGLGCGSMVGYRQIAAQPIFLLEPGCTKPGTIVHEIGHAVGFYHEHSRQDRDKYIDINFQNVIKSRIRQFVKMRSRNYAQYDVGSIMHYGRKYFGKVVTTNIRLPTISSKDKHLNFLLGQRGRLSYYDIMAVNLAYGCTDHCETKHENPCHNGGFVFKDCSCACPDGLTGTHCDQIELSWASYGCSDIVTLGDNGKKTLSSPNYPKEYEKIKCFWLIKAPTGKHLDVHFTLREIPHSPISHRCYHWLEIRYNLMGQTGHRYCGRHAMQDLTTSTENMVMVMFDGSHKAFTGTGFKIAVTVVDSAGGNRVSLPCKYGKSFINEDGDKICVCSEGFSGKECGIVEFAYCIFKDNMCIFENWEDNSRDWKKGKIMGRFPKDMAGEINYIYVNTRSVSEASVAVITSAIITGGSHCLVFNHFIYPDKVTELTAHFTSTDFKDLLRYRLDTTHTNYWTSNQIFISSERPFRVKFLASLNSSGTYDVAVHDFVIDKGECAERTTTAMVCLDFLKILKKDDILFKCDFEKSDCGFTSKRKAIFWRRVRYGVYGPYKDHTTGTKGKFMMESNFLKVIGDVAELKSKVITVCGKSCLQFWYFYKSIKKGRLSVFLETKRIRINLNVLGELPPYVQWSKAQKTLPNDIQSFKIAFVVAAQHHWGSYAIDDVTITAGPCGY